MVQLEEARAELGHVHLHRALPGAGLARQAAGHGVEYLMGKIRLATPPAQAVAQPPQEAEPVATADRRGAGEHVDTRLALQPQPLANQRGAALG
ncbi:hypothetical protein D3C84_1006360 [compost metagenome]